MTRAEAAAALGSGWRHLPLRDPELRYTPAPPAPPPTFTRAASRSRAAAAAAGSLLLSALHAGH